MMQVLKPPRVLILRDGRVRIARGAWSETIPADLLPARIRFYTREAKAKGGRHAAAYQPMVEALTAAWRRIEGAGNG